MELWQRNKAEGDAPLFDKLAELIKAAPAASSGASSASAAAGTVGVLAKQLGDGPFATEWLAALERAGVTRVDATAGLVESTVLKDKYGAEALKQAGLFSAAVLRKSFIPAFAKAVDENDFPSLSDLSAGVTATVMDSKPRDLSSTLKDLDDEFVDVGIPACVQCGSDLDLDLVRAKPSSKALTTDTVAVAFAGRYRSYHALVARTYLVNPTASQSKAYKALIEAHGTLLQGLRAGEVIGGIVARARAILTEALPGAVVPESLGSGMGVRLEEPSVQLVESSERKVEEGMCFAVITGFTGAANDEVDPAGKGNAKFKTFSQVLADTVMVLAPDGPYPSFVLTDKAKRELSSVRFQLKEDEEDDEEEDEEEDDEDDDGEDAYAAEGGVRRSSRIKEVVGDTDALAAARERREQALLKIFQRSVADARDAMKRASGDGDKETAKEAAVRKAKPLAAFASPAEFPPSAAPNRVHVDKERRCVLLPIHGELVPFHVATIRSVNKNEEGGRTYLRINFFSPGQSAGKACPPQMLAAMERHPAHLYVRTLTYQAKDGRNLSHALRLIKDIQKRMQAETTQRHERSNLVKQPKLALNRGGRVPRLQRLSMWPNLSGRKCLGALEAHHNGFRFRSDRGEILDIIYDNVKHAIFQPCKRDLHVIIHLHLDNPIMVGKKKHRDVKFFTEVMEAAQSLEGSRRSMYDPDELAEEQRERKLRKQLNTAFRTFVQKCEDAAQAEPSPSALEFDVPSRDLSFYGRAHKEMVELSPCRDCLVALGENPPFVLSLDDVEHVHFERVMYSAKNFDIAFVLKATAVQPGQDEVVMVNMVPMASLESVQNWLVDVEEKLYTQGTRTMNWKAVMAEVRRPTFYASEDEDGEKKPVGWAFLMDTGESDAEGGEEEDAGDEAFSAESEDADDDAEFDEAVEEEEDDEDDEDEEDEDDEDEEAADWDQLAQDAMEDDKRAELVEKERAVRDADRIGAPKRGRSGGESSAKRSRRA